VIPIVWTDLALDDFSENIYYLEKKWTEKEIEKFIKKSHEILDKLSKGNIKFKPTAYKNVFQIVIIKQITLFYKIEDTTILLLRFWNNYKNPTNFKL
jgi:plasmid stabilization system protein ParE